jgi:hypothetical protein
VQLVLQDLKGLKEQKEKTARLVQVDLALLVLLDSLVLLDQQMVLLDQKGIKVAMVLLVQVDLVLLVLLAQKEILVVLLVLLVQVVLLVVLLVLLEDLGLLDQVGKDLPDQKAPLVQRVLNQQKEDHAVKKV